SWGIDDAECNAGVARRIDQLCNSWFQANALRRRQRNYDQVDLVTLRASTDSVDRLHVIKIMRDRRIGRRIGECGLRAAGLGNQLFTSGSNAAENLVINYVGAPIFRHFPNQVRSKLITRARETCWLRQFGRGNVGAGIVAGEKSLAT